VVARTLAGVRTFLASAVVLALLAGCARSASGPTATWSDGVGPSASAPPAGPVEITLAFAGDVHFTERTLKLLRKPETAFGPVAEILGAADLAMVNLESAVTTRGTPEPKTFHFRAPETAYAAVAAAGVDVVSVANNHALDYGRVGLADTLSSAEAAGMPIVGAGENVTEAYRPWIATVKGVKIAFLGMSQVAELRSSWAAKADRSGIAYTFDGARATAAVKAAKKAADVVVVYLHWGLEYNECPTSQMKTFAKRMADAGASIVVGTHAHVLLGDGWLGSTFVAYGLSNFLWWYNDAASNDTGVLRIKLRDTAIVDTEFLPAYINRTTGQPIPVRGSEATRITKKYTNLRRCTGLSSSPR
jgi:poly-gamma-glutamate capsule biosynthesis protein CapA/YwtB (metallophosphatase superfamily)